MTGTVRKGQGNLRRWELALLLAVGISMLAGTWLAGQQTALTQKVVRLHVIGTSDSAEDQAVKLQVRDAVLAQASALLEGAESAQKAETVLSSHLEELARAGAEVSGVPVTASMERDVWFPTKQYTDFSLPAGRYTALQVTVGEGDGRNWWCVVFPPLCLGSVTEEVASQAGNFSDDQVKLITGEEENYQIRFRALELWNEWTDRMR